MKYIHKILSVFILAAFTLLGCEEDPENPVFGDTEMPRILFDWQSTITLKLNDSLILAPQVSPSDGATYEWVLNDEVISTERILKRKFSEFGQYQLIFNVKRNNISNSRTARIAIQKSTFEPKVSNKKVIGFVTPTATLEDIQWDYITHLVISSARVSASGVDTAINAADPNNSEMKKMIFMAYNYGVYVMLDLTGVINNYVNCGGAYANYDFYNTIADAAKRTELINTVALFVKNNRFDGLNIFLNNTSEGAPFADPASVTSFFNDMHAALNAFSAPKGQMLYSATVPVGWTASVLDMVATNENFDWVNVHSFASQDLTPVHSSPQWQFTDGIATWTGMGVPANKIVGGIPAFGRNYNFPDGVVITWGNVDEYATWISYNSVLEMDANAPNLDPSQFNVTAKTGVFYEGFSNIDAKAQYIINNDMGGLLVWSIENDSPEPSKSLLKRVFEGLNGSK